MPYVTSIFARRMVQAAGPSVDGPMLLRSVGLNPDAPLDVAERIAADAYYDLLERIAGRLADAHELPLRVGPLMRHDDYGARGLAWKSAPTVRQSLARVVRYCRLWTGNMTYELREEGDQAVFLLHRAGERRLGLRLSNEATVASAVSLIRLSSAPSFHPQAVDLQHAGPADVTAHERYFGCPVRFGAPRDAIVIDQAALDRPNHLADDGISRFLLDHLDTEMSAESDAPPLEDLLRQAISRALSGGVPAMEEVARRLALSKRTLQRRLAEQGLSYRAEVDATRRRLAENLLRQSPYPLSEVAFLTGFSEQSAFNRAFKRWTGQTPTGFRNTAGTRSRPS